MTIEMHVSEDKYSVSVIFSEPWLRIDFLVEFVDDRVKYLSIVESSDEYSICVSAKYVGYDELFTVSYSKSFFDKELSKEILEKRSEYELVLADIHISVKDLLDNIVPKIHRGKISDQEAYEALKNLETKLVILVEEA